MRTGNEGTTVAATTDRWHVDKGIPIAVIVMLLAQFAWFSHRDGIRERTLGDHERRITAVESQRITERLATLEAQQVELKAQQSEIKALVQRVDGKLDRALDRGR